MAKVIYRTAFAEYTPKSSIGGGGSGDVYHVIDNNNNEFGLKLLEKAVIYSKKEGAWVIGKEKFRRFKNETFFCIQNPHKNIVQVKDYGFIEKDTLNIPFYVMPYYPKTLRKLIKETIPADKILVYFSQILDGVEDAHLRQVFHRDLKPENILCDPAQDLLVIADFGIARFHEEELATLVETRNGDRLANFQYAAPEQGIRGANIDHRCDVFALGLILNEMFTGQIIRGTGHVTIGKVAPKYAYLDDIVKKVRAQDPDNRYQSIDMLKLDLMEHAQGIFERQRMDNFTKEVIVTKIPEDPYVLTLNRILSDRSVLFTGGTVDQLPLAHIYNYSLKLIQNHDMIGFNSFKNHAINSVPQIMKDWYRSHSKNGLPVDMPKRYESIDSVIESLGPLYVTPLAALESMNPDLYDPGIVDDLLNPSGWPYYGVDTIYQFPCTLAFVFQIFYGAKNITISQLIPAFDLLTKRIRFGNEREFKQFWRHYEIMHHPCTIGPNWDMTWFYIWDAPERMQWLQTIFGGVEPYRQALLAYCIALNIFELADLINRNRTEKLNNSYEKSLPSIPPLFWFAPMESRRRAVNLLAKNEKVLASCWMYVVSRSGNFGWQN